MSGLALPALMLAVPVAAVSARRTPAWAPLLAGLAAIGGGELLAAGANSASTIGVIRVVEGLGAGAVLPAGVVLVWEQRRRLLGALWSGVFVAAFLVSVPVAISTIAQVDESGWRTVLRPAPELIGLAILATIAHIVACVRERGPGRRSVSPLPVQRRNERTQLLLPLVPAAGFAFLAIATTFGWTPSARLIVAGLGGLGLLGLAIVGSRGAVTGSPLACAVVTLTVGLAAFPVVAPLVGMLSMHGGIGEVSALPYLVGGALAVVGAVTMVGAGRTAAFRGLLGGHAAVVAAVLLLLSVDMRSDQWSLLPAVGLLGLGLGMALSASLREAEVGAVLFAVSLSFPAVLTGHLVVGSFQLAAVRPVLAARSGEEAIAAAFTAGFRGWLIVAAVCVALIAAVVALLHRSRAVRPSGPAAGTSGDGSERRRPPVPPARPEPSAVRTDQRQRRISGAGAGEPGAPL
jgi:hypothetical protein